MMKKPHNRPDKSSGRTPGDGKGANPPGMPRVLRPGAASNAKQGPLISPKFRPAAPDPGPQASTREQVDFFAGQVQSLATRLEALRGQGAGHAPEFQQLENLLNAVQDKLLLAQQRLQSRS